MKQLRFLLASLVLVLSFSLTSLETHAQAPEDTAFVPSIDSSAIKANVTLIEDHHLLILDCLEDMKSPLALSYGAQISKGLTTRTVNGVTEAVYEPTKPITVTVTEGFIKEVYILMGVQQERFASGINDDIRDALLPQLQSGGHTWLLSQLGGVQNFNSSLKQQKINRGFNTAKSFL